MRALTFLKRSPAAEQTTIQELPEPTPGPGQVTIDVRAAGINFVDILARRGEQRYAPTWPHHPGHEVAGTIRALGADVTGLSVGDRVVATTPDGGGLAEVALADASLIARTPDGLADVVAAAAPAVLSTGLLLLTEAGRWRPGDSVVLHSAAGGVGSAVAQLVAALGGGLRVRTVGHPDKIAAARAAGWDVVIVRGPDQYEQIREALPGGADLVLDALGPSSVEQALALLAPLGRVVAFGNASGEPPRPLPPVFQLIAASNAVGGFSVSALCRRAPERVAAATTRGFELLATGEVSLPVTEVGALEQVGEVHEILAAGQGQAKYVLAVGG
jgi:NADPH2:quinone reductase